MAYTTNFSAVQNSNLTTLFLTDTSSGGTDTNITSRKIYLYRVDSTTLVPTGTTTDYINWPIVNSSGIGDTINIDVLSRDYSLSIFVVVTSSSPIGGAVYQKTVLFTCTGNTNQQAYGLIQQVSANPKILNDKGYAANLSKLFLQIKCATTAQTYNDQSSAQSALDRAYELYTHQSLYF